MIYPTVNRIFKLIESPSKSFDKLCWKSSENPTRHEDYVADRLTQIQIFRIINSQFFFPMAKENRHNPEIPEIYSQSPLVIFEEIIFPQQKFHVFFIALIWVGCC